MDKPLPTCEVYGPVVQGEGSVIGLPTIFVRLGGCDFRCAWCDSMYAVDPQYKKQWTPRSAQEITDQVHLLSENTPLLVTLSGGNPAIHDCEPLITQLQMSDYLVALETQGTVAKPWFRLLDVLTLSPKPPSSKMPCDEEKLAACIDAAGPHTTMALKIVVFDQDDYLFAQRIHYAHRSIAMVLQVGNPTVATDQRVDVKGMLHQLDMLQRRVIADRWYDVRVLPQLHVLIHGNQRER